MAVATDGMSTVGAVAPCPPSEGLLPVIVQKSRVVGREKKEDSVTEPYFIGGILTS